MRYYLYSRKNDGLFDKEQLRCLLIEKDDLVKAEDADSWLEAEKVADLHDLFEHPEEVLVDEYTEDVVEPEVKQDTKTEEDSFENFEQAAPAESATVQNPVGPVPLKRNALICFAAVIAAMVLLTTNPKKSSHYEVVQQMVVEGLQSQGESRSWGESLMDMFFRGFGFFDDMAVERLLNDVECHNAYLFSYSKVDDEIEGSHWVTFGILGHVYSMNQEALNSHISNVLYGPRKQKPEKRQTPRRKQKPQQLPENGQSL